MMTEEEWQNFDRAELVELLKRKDFRRFCMRILNMCNVEGCGYVPSSFDGTAFNCGQISIGLMLKKWIKNADKGSLSLMGEEFEAEVKQREEARTEDY